VSSATTVAAAGVVACASTGLLATWLPRVGLLDVPNHRSSHARPTPRGGGLGVIAGVAAGLAVSPPGSTLAVGLVGALLLAAVGLVDDVRSLPATHRLAVQLVVSLVAAIVAVGTADLGGVGGVAVALVAALWLSGYVNVFNFMDGANGLAGLNAVIAGATYAWVGHAEGSPALLVGGSVLLGAAAGFLPWNFPRARIFLGDVGSYSIGFLVAWLTLVGLLTTDRPAWCVAPVLVVLLDTGLTLARRARRGVPLTEAHREHVYQRLSTTPGSPLPALLVATVGAGFVLAAGAPVAWCLAVWTLLAAAYVASPVLARGWRG
jgi:UDP-N-acetylmuramyl pentapeptide phosphotransferase/UDP-N-acetylglucosamine-1-phosphate transferase